MTSVIGHLTGLEFGKEYKGWTSCPPSMLFEVPVFENVDAVSAFANCAFDDSGTDN